MILDLLVILVPLALLGLLVLAVHLDRWVLQERLVRQAQLGRLERQDLQELQDLWEQLEPAVLQEQREPQDQ